MRYVSTRGASPPRGFLDVLLAGPARDGGLFMPEAWPRFEVSAFAGKPYAEAAYAVLKPFVGGEFSDEELKADLDAAYADFDRAEIAPLVRMGPDTFLLELFHGPTLAFKDIALQSIGRLFARALQKRGGRATVLVATSGDTGSAAIAALGGLPNIEVFVIHPRGRVSEVQRLQMTTAPHANVHNVALEGTFDDAQSIVKTLFADAAFAERTHLAAVNSINFVRIAAQSVYYSTALAALGREAAFVVPTGNFGDVFAGEAARRMGLPVGKLIVATNRNDIVARALNEGVYAPGAARPTLSPSMDIQVASNFERALFEASGRDADWVRAAMAAFAESSSLILPPPVLAELRALYEARSIGDAETLETIARVHRETGRFIDPHTAVAVAAAPSGGPTVILSTAHPAKFPEAVRRATGEMPPLPPRLKGLYEGVERVTTLANDPALIRAFIERNSARP